MEVKSAPTIPSGLNGAPTGLMVRAGSGGLRVRSDDYAPWLKQGGYLGVRLR